MALLHRMPVLYATCMRGQDRIVTDKGTALRKETDTGTCLPLIRTLLLGRKYQYHITRRHLGSKGLLPQEQSRSGEESVQLSMAD